MVEVFRGVVADKSLVDAVAHCKCDSSESIPPLGKVSLVKEPSCFVFNEEVLLDLFDVHDDNRNVSVCLNIVCNGTTYQVACHVREGNGLPTSKKCFMKFKIHWASHFGFP